MLKQNKTLLVGAIIFMAIILPGVYYYRHPILEMFTISRAHDLPSTFLRMSPELKSEQENYIKTCQGDPKCDKRKYKSHLNSIVQREWSRVYDYLKYKENWGDGRLTRPTREQFFRELRGYSTNSVGTISLRSVRLHGLRTISP